MVKDAKRKCCDLFQTIHLAPDAPQNPRIENSVAVSAQFFQFFINKDATTSVLITAPVHNPSVAQALVNSSNQND